MAFKTPEQIEEYKRRSTTMTNDTMTNDTTSGWGGTGYGKPVPKQGGSDLFYLQSVGQQATLRLVTEPYVYTKSGISKRTGQPYNIPSAAWGAILKLDSVNPSEGPKAVVLTESSDLYEAVGTLFDDPNFGDPSRYDIVVTSILKPNGYTSVTVDASPTKDTGPTDAEIAMLTEAQCLTVGQVEATIQRIMSAPKKPAPTPTVTPGADYDPEHDPFRTG